MAVGTVTFFDEGKLAIANGVHDFDSDSFKVGFVNVMPLANASAPTLASHSECAAGGNYTAGGFAMTAVTLANASGTITHDFSTNISMVKLAGNPTDVVAGIIYNTSKANQAVGWVEIAAAGADGTVGLISVDWAGTGVFTLAG